MSEPVRTELHVELSKFLSDILRHTPEVGGITLDEEGWADVDELIKNNSKKFTRQILEEIVATDNKRRYTFSEDGTKIRANQGHSINVDLKFEPVKPPKLLYHGTATRFLDSIMSEGLKRMRRLYVHLSERYETAVSVGKRHGTVVVLDVNSEQMDADGIKFYLSKNGVWLTKHVPAKYLKVHEE
jgi:putative RNA 2'-phosphotransferase